MLAEALVLAALGIAIVGLLCDAVSQRRLIRSIQAHLAASDKRHEDTLDRDRKRDARIDRLQRIVTDQGWRDSMLLTRWDWRDPKDRG
jgi:hypothetical protein